MRSRYLLPDGEVSDGVRELIPDGDWLRMADAHTGSSLNQVEFYVPPYMMWDDALGILSRLPSLRVVQVLTAGVDWIVPHLPAGVTLCRGVGIHEVSVTELVITTVLAMTKGIPEFVRHQSGAEWRHRRTPCLSGARAVILGHGAIGASVGRALESLGVEVTGVSRSGRAPSVPFSELPELLPHADLLIVLLPLTAQTIGIVDAVELALLPDGALVVNASRGATVDATALERELVSGRLRGALDVTDPEPLPASSPLWSLPNVLITPHVGGDTDLFPQLAARVVADQMIRYGAGQPLMHQVVGDY